MKILYLLSLLLCLAFACEGGEGISPERQQRAQEVYKARMEYARSKDYAPYGTKAREADANAGELLARGECREAIAEADKGLQFDPFNFGLWMIKAAAHGKLGQAEQAAAARDQWIAIVDSIVLNGDGQSFETAWTVINIAEEYAVLGLLKWRSKRQSRVEHSGKKFDIIQAQQNESEKTASFYFNVDAPAGRLFDKPGKAKGK